MTASPHAMRPSDGRKDAGTLQSEAGARKLSRSQLALFQRNGYLQS